MLDALFWGAVAASSLLIGGLLGLGRRWPAPVLGFVLAFGAGALISAISFDLARSGFRIGGGRTVDDWFHRGRVPDDGLVMHPTRVVAS